MKLTLMEKHISNSSPLGRLGGVSPLGEVGWGFISSFPSLLPPTGGRSR